MQIQKTIINFLTNRIKKGKKPVLILSGGDSPINLYKSISKFNLNWSKVIGHLLDERNVGLNNKFSNYNLLKKNLKINKAHNIKIFSLLSIAKDNKKKKAMINLFKNSKPLAILGMGNDGHYASIFSNSKILNKLTDIHNKPDVLSVEKNGTPKLKRTTMNLSMILMSYKIILILNTRTKQKVFIKACHQKHYKFSIRTLIKNAHKKLIIYDSIKLYRFNDFIKKFKIKTKNLLI
jgi:6-phosphogluconolactonase